MRPPEAGRPARILCVGALTEDIILQLDRIPAGSGKFIPHDMIRVAAGMATSAACAARRQGAEVALWASAGDDANGDALVAEITREGIDCSAVRRVAGARSAVATILVDAVGERMIVPYYDPRTQASPEAAPFADFARFDAVLVDVRWPGAARLALQGAKAAGIPAILDADVAAREILLELLPHATHVVASEPAAAILCGDDMTPEDGVQTLAEQTGAFVAITAGGRGTWWLEPASSTVRHTPAPRIKPVDTLAAGDVFHGSFAVGLAEGWAMDRVIAFASAAAALKCLTFGGRLGAPTRSETIAFMETAV